MSLKVFLLLTLVAAAAASPAPAPAPAPTHGLFNPLAKLNDIFHVENDIIGKGVGSLFRTVIGAKHTARGLLKNIVSYKIKSLEDLLNWSVQVSIGLGDVVDASISTLGNLIVKIMLAMYRIVICHGGYGSSSICSTSLNTQVGVQAVTAANAQALLRLFGLLDIKAQMQLILNRCSKGRGFRALRGSYRAVLQLGVEMSTKMDDYINGRYVFVNDDLTYCLNKFTILYGVIGNSRQRGSGLTFAKNFVPLANKYLRAARCKTIDDWNTIEVQLSLGDGDNAPWGNIDPKAQTETGVTINLGIGQLLGGIFRGLIGVTRLAANLIEDIAKIVLNSFEDCINLGIKILFGLGGLLDATVSGLGTLLVRIVAGLLKIVLCFLGTNKGYGVCRPGWDAQFNINYGVYSIGDTVRAYGLRDCRQLAEDYIFKFTGSKEVSSTATDSRTILFRSTLTLARMAEAGKWDKNILITIYTHLSYLFGAIGNSNAKGVGTEACNRFIPAVSKWLNDEGYPGFAANEDQVFQLISGANGDYNFWTADANTDVNTKPSGFIIPTGVSGSVGGSFSLGGLVGGILKPIRGITGLAGSILAEIINIKINVLADVFGLTIRLILGLGGAINTTIRGLGSLLIRIVAFIFKVGVCFKGFPGDRSICNNRAWNLRFGVDGEANSADSLYILFNMGKTESDYNNCIKSYNGKGNGAAKVIIEQSRILVGFVKGGHSSITKETISKSIVSVTTMTGAVANANKKDSGKEIIQKFYPACGPKLVDAGYPDITVYINTTIVVIGNANGDTDTWTSTGNNNGGDNTGNNNGGDNTGNNNGGNNTGNNNGGNNNGGNNTGNNNGGNNTGNNNGGNNNGGDNTGNNNGGDNTGNNNGGDNTGNNNGGNNNGNNNGGNNTGNNNGGNNTGNNNGGDNTGNNNGGDNTGNNNGGDNAGNNNGGDNTGNNNGGDNTGNTPAPNTPAPKTPAPTTQAPKTPAPTTQAPKTPAPTTQAPKTPAPTTQAPKTPAPTTRAPKTPAPTTAAPETPAPTTPAPETPAPTTQAPDTPAPETPAPDTPAPTDNNDSTTVAPTDNDTPAPTDNNTPAPSDNNTPAPTGDNTPAPSDNNTPAPSDDSTLAPTGNTPAPYGNGNNTPAPTGNGNNTPAPTGNGNNNGGQTGGSGTVGGSVSVDIGVWIGGALKGYSGVGKLAANILTEIINIKITAFRDVVQLIIRVALAIGGVIDSVVVGLGSLFARLVAVIFKIGICVNGFPGDQSICTAAFNAPFGINGNANTAKDLITLYGLDSCKEDAARIRQSIGNKVTSSITIVLDKVDEMSGWVSSKTITKQYFSSCSGHLFTVVGAITNSNSKGSGTQLVQRIVGPCNKYFVTAGYPTIIVNERTIDVSDNGQVNWKSGVKVNGGTTVVVKGDGLVTNVKDLFKNVKDKNNVKKTTVTAVMNLDIPSSLDGVFQFGIKVILALGNIIDIFIGQLGSLLIRLFGFLLRYIVCVLGGSRNSKSFVCQKAYFDTFSVTASDNSWAGLLASFKIENPESDLDGIIKSFKNGDRKKYAGSESLAVSQCSALVTIFKKKSSIAQSDLTEVFRIVATIFGGFANSWSVDLGKKIVENMVPVCSGFLVQNNYPELNNQLPAITSSIQGCNNDKAIWSQSTTTTVEYQN